MIAAVGLCRAESVCPWLNKATAGGVLGGPVSAVVKQTSCEFMRPSGAVLRIEVQKKPAAPRVKCETGGMALKAIGNEAVACLSGGAEVVIGRVRDQRFAVSIRGVKEVREKVTKVAEQVAGNLF